MPEKQIDNINIRFKKVRKQLKLGQAEFAERAKINQSQVSEIENGKRNITAAIILALEDNLGVDRKWLENEIGEMFKRAKNHPENVEETPRFKEPGTPYQKMNHYLEKKPQNIPVYNESPEVAPGGSASKAPSYLNIPGVAHDSFALPVHGDSMHPTLADGVLGIVRPIEDKKDIEWGQVYYIEYGDYRVWKRLIKDDDPDSVVLYSDNISEMINGQPKYAAKTIKLERISKLCLLTDILMKPNF